MSVITQEVINLMEMLPENEQSLAYEMIKRIVLAWDGDYTKLTPQERKQLEQAEDDFMGGETISHNDIDWN